MSLQKSKKAPRIPKKKVKKRSASAMTREIDGLQSKAIRACGRCFAAGYVWDCQSLRCDATAQEYAEASRVYQCSDHFDCAHLKSRRHKLIRFSPSNTVCLCNVHHRFFTEHPDLWTSFIEEKLPGRWDHLNALLLGGGKVDYPAHLAFWKAELARVEQP